MDVDTSRRDNFPTKDVGVQDADLRGKIVEILSNTANDCLSELGYYPGMTKQLHNALQANAQFQGANAKLYEDNMALARVVAAQNDQIAFLTGAGNDQLQKFKDMGARVKSLVAERDDLQRRNEALVKDIPVDKRFEAIASELRSLQLRHDAVQREYKRLREEYSSFRRMAAANGFIPSRAVVGGHPPTSQPQGPGNSTQTPMHTNQRSASDSQVPNPVTIPRWASNVPLNAQHRKRGSGIQFQNSTAILKPSILPTIKMMKNRLPIASRSHTLPTLQTTQLHHADTSLPTPAENITQYYTMPPASSERILHNPKHPLTPLAINARSLPITPISPDLPRNATQQIVQGWNPSISKTPADVPQGSRVVNLIADNEVPVLTNSPTAPGPIDQDVTVLSPVSSVDEPLIANYYGGGAHLRPQSPGPQAEDAVMHSPASSVEEPLMKRSSQAMADGEKDMRDVEPNKRPRLDNASPTYDNAADNKQTVDELVGELLIEPVEEEEILVSEQECVDSVFEADDDDESSKICTLCALRYAKGAIDEPQKPFLNTTLDILIAHCVDEHPSVWEILRRSPQ